MKNIIYLLLISLTILSCSNNDNSLEDPIIGKWKLLRITSDGTYTPEIIDCTDKNTIYNFTNKPSEFYFIDDTSELIITGAENAGYPNGKYDYYFREDYLEPGPWGVDDKKVLLVAINGAKYAYSLIDGIMTFGLSHLEGGPDFVLKRVN